MCKTLGYFGCVVELIEKMQIFDLQREIFSMAGHALGKMMMGDTSMLKKLVNMCGFLKSACFHARFVLLGLFAFGKSLKTSQNSKQ